MRPYLLRHPAALAVVVALAAADVVYRVLGLHEPVKDVVLKGGRR